MSLDESGTIELQKRALIVYLAFLLSLYKRYLNFWFGNKKYKNKCTVYVQQEIQTLTIEANLPCHLQSFSLSYMILWKNRIFWNPWVDYYVGLQLKISQSIQCSCESFPMSLNIPPDLAILHWEPVGRHLEGKLLREWETMLFCEQFDSFWK